MKVKVDITNDAVYFRLDDSIIVESEEIASGVILDYDKKNNVVGVELLGATKRVPLDKLKKMEFETT